MTGPIQAKFQVPQRVCDACDCLGNLDPCWQCGGPTRPRQAGKDVFPALGDGLASADLKHLWDDE